MRGLWTISSRNKKTADVPTLYVGETVEETRKSCQGCPLLPGARVTCPDCGHLNPPEATTCEECGAELPQCYAWLSMIRNGLTSIQKSAARGVDKSLDSILAAIDRKRTRPRIARLGAIGDPTHVRGLPRMVSRLRAAGLAIVGYTHHWKRARNRKHRGHLMASCSPAEVPRAVNAGFRPAVILPADTPIDTRFYSIGRDSVACCPAIRNPGKVTCDNCKLCDPENPIWEIWKRLRIIGIGFINHDPAARTARKRGQNV